MGPTQRPKPAPTPTSILRTSKLRHACNNIASVQSAPAQYQWIQRARDGHNPRTENKHRGARADGPLAPPAVHDHVGDKTTEQAAHGVDGGDDGERRVGHGDACRETVVGLHVECRVGLSATCEDGLDLVEGRNVVAVLLRAQGQRRGDERKSRRDGPGMKRQGSRDSRASRRA